MTAWPAGNDDYAIDIVLKWILLAVGIVCFGVFTYATVLTYQKAPPQPARFVGPDGHVVMTAARIDAGKAGFQKADLMDYGSLYGMGSYYGEDYTAAYVTRLGALTRDAIARQRYDRSYETLDAGRRYEVRQAMKNQLRGIDLTRRDVSLPGPVADAIGHLRTRITTRLQQNDFNKGWTRARALDAGQARDTADFLIYSALTTVAERPGSHVSWTQNWPYQPSVGNTPTSSTFEWTWISFCFTFFAFGAVLFIYQRWLNVPDETLPRDPVLSQFRPLTPSQRATGKYFLVVAALLLVQIAAGALMAHDYSERADFYGININYWLPFNFLRDLHIQLPIVWIGLSWIGGALFLGPAISGREARGQARLVNILFWATIAVVAGAVIGDYLGILGVIEKGWFWVGNQGLSYIQLGRLWQIGFFAGLILWSAMVFRALWPTRDELITATRNFWTGNIRLENLLWAATINIAVMYVFGMIPLTGINNSFTLTDFWRWWVVHLWVEQSFEFFAAAISAYLLMAVGLVSRRLAERAVYFELILIFLGGVLGTGHHMYWVGEPGMWVPLGSMFSFIEVLPLMLLIIEAIEQHRLIKAHSEFRYGLAYTYIIGAAFWNFVGAGVFGGGTINAPLVNYFEHGTFLTLNHAHTALFGAFGLLAIGLIYFCLRYALGERVRYGHRLGLTAFWLYNAGLVLWIALNFFPIGWPQLVAVYEHGYAYARSMAFYNTTTLWQWLRFPGDVVFAAGALLMALDFILKLRPMLPEWARFVPGWRTPGPIVATRTGEAPARASEAP